MEDIIEQESFYGCELDLFEINGINIDEPRYNIHDLAKNEVL